MRLIILLICLGLERYTDTGAYLKRFNWFGAYLNLLRKIIPSDALWRGHLGMVWVTVPALILIGLIYFLSIQLVGFWLASLINLVFLFYCFGPEPLHATLKNYFSSQDSHDSANAAKAATELFSQDGDTQGTESGARGLTQTIFIKANSHVFAVTFWFILVGLLGAVLYRLTSQMHRETQHAKSPYKALSDASTQWLGVLDWLPIRLMALAFALAGSFTQSFTYWLTGVISGFTKNRDFLVGCALTAINARADAPESADVTENKMAVAIVDRAFIIALVLIAVFTLGAWIY